MPNIVITPPTLFFERYYEGVSYLPDYTIEADIPSNITITIDTFLLNDVSITADITLPLDPTVTSQTYIMAGLIVDLTLIDVSLNAVGEVVGIIDASLDLPSITIELTTRLSENIEIILPDISVETLIERYTEADGLFEIPTLKISTRLEKKSQIEINANISVGSFSCKSSSIRVLLSNASVWIPSVRIESDIIRISVTDILLTILKDKDLSILITSSISAIITDEPTKEIVGTVNWMLSFDVKQSIINNIVSNPPAQGYYPDGVSEELPEEDLFEIGGDLANISVGGGIGGGLSAFTTNEPTTKLEADNRDLLPSSFMQEYYYTYYGASIGFRSIEDQSPANDDYVKSLATVNLKYATAYDSELEETFRVASLTKYGSVSLTGYNIKTPLILWKMELDTATIDAKSLFWVRYNDSNELVLAELFEESLITETGIEFNIVTINKYGGIVLHLPEILGEFLPDHSWQWNEKTFKGIVILNALRTYIKPSADIDPQISITYDGSLSTGSDFVRLYNITFDSNLLLFATNAHDLALKEDKVTTIPVTVEDYIKVWINPDAGAKVDVVPNDARYIDLHATNTSNA